MSKTVPTYEEGTKLKNNENDDRYAIVDVSYDKSRCQIMYKLQGQRFHFNTFNISQSALLDNLAGNSYERID